MATPAYRLLSDNGAEIDVVAYQFSRELFEGIPFVRRGYFASSILGFVWQMIRARVRGYDLVLQFNTSLLNNLLLFLACSRRLGYDYNGKGRLNTIRIPLPIQTIQRGYRGDECLALIERGLGFTTRDRRMTFVPRDYPPEISTMEAKYVVLHISCRDKQRQWPHWKELSDRLWNDYVVLLTGDKGDGFGLDKFNLCGKLTISELAWLLKRCQFVVTLNTFTLHLAIALDVPTIALIGRTPAEVVIPAGARVRVFEDPALKRELRPSDKARMGEVSAADLTDSFFEA